jgi:hypothetical protein
MSFRYRLLFVGVNTVPGGASLQAAARDAEAMSSRFAGWGYGSRTRHHLLVHRDVTRARVLAELQTAVATPGLDLLLVYWAGHLSPGVRKHVLATHESDAEGGLGLDVLVGAVAGATSARHRVVVVDACNAAAASAQLASLSLHVGGDSSVAVFAAGGSDASSREYHRRGYFTGSLLAQLPCEARGVPPSLDLLQALRTGAERHPTYRREQPFVGVFGAELQLRLPAIGRTLPFVGRTRQGRVPLPVERPDALRQRA